MILEFIKNHKIISILIIIILFVIFSVFTVLIIVIIALVVGAILKRGNKKKEEVSEVIEKEKVVSEVEPLEKEKELTNDQKLIESIMGNKKYDKEIEEKIIKGIITKDQIKKISYEKLYEDVGEEEGEVDQETKKIERILKEREEELIKELKQGEKELKELKEVVSEKVSEEASEVVEPIKKEVEVSEEVSEKVEPIKKEKVESEVFEHYGTIKEARKILDDEVQKRKILVKKEKENMDIKIERTNKLVSDKDLLIKQLKFKKRHTRGEVKRNKIKSDIDNIIKDIDLLIKDKKEYSYQYSDISPYLTLIEKFINKIPQIDKISKDTYDQLIFHRNTIIKIMGRRFEFINNKNIISRHYTIVDEYNEMYYKISYIINVYEGNIEHTNENYAINFTLVGYQGIGGFI